MAVPSGDVVFELVWFQIHRPVLKVIFHQTASFFFWSFEQKHVTELFIELSLSFNNYIDKKRWVKRSIDLEIHIFLVFSILPKKTNEKIRLNNYDSSSRIVYVHFLEEFKTPKIHFEINWPLSNKKKYLISPFCGKNSILELCFENCSFLLWEKIVYNQNSVCISSA